MALRFNLTWMPQAETNMRKIREYYLKNELSAIDAIFGAIRQEIARIAESPHRGDIYRRLNGDVIRESLAGSYRIIFRVSEEEEQIDILRIWHTSRDEPELDEFD